ncbi:MAG TPA: hypothetical protein VH142_16500 [Polyangiaceae bacterium]|jgi:hypothetical protein|nr:hypothetical protein [Polyangiaceae bacterium]
MSSRIEIVHWRSFASGLFRTALVALVGVGVSCSSASDGSSGKGSSGTPATTGCGDGMIELGEDCDGTNVGTATCATATGNPAASGTLGCLNCKFYTNECSTGPTGAGGSVGVGGFPVTSGGFPSNTGGDTTGSSGGFGGITASGGTAGIGGSGGTIGSNGGTSAATGGAGAVAAGGGSATPTIPPDPGDCPNFANGTITYEGLDGIQVAVGTKSEGPTAPMLFYWHGTGSTSGEYAFMAAPVAAGITAAGGVIVSFQNSTGGDLLSGTSIFGAGDFKLTDGLAACAVKNFNVDPRRIYTMGCSAGGLFAAAMAAERSNYIAAASSNSGGWVVPVTFEGSYTPPYMAVHGAPGTDVVVVDFSMTSATAEMAWKQRGGFSMDCNTGGGHCGGAGLAGDVWTFFQAHPYGVSPEPYASALPSGFSTECTID